MQDSTADDESFSDRYFMDGTGGDRVTDRSEQEALLDILVKTEKTHSLSTAKAQKDLQEAWGWTMPTEALRVL